MLAAHHPGVEIFEDVRQIDAKTPRPDIICGGFPCQPHSLAGRRRGTKDDRWLWPQFQRIVEALKPSIVFVENVPGLRTSGLRDVLSGLASIGFDATWDCFTAAEIGAPHIRRRLFVLAYADGGAVGIQRGRRRGTQGKKTTLARSDGGECKVADTVRPRLAIRREQAAQLFAGGDGSRDCGCKAHCWPAEPDVGRVAHGVPARAHRLRLLGNACVPAQAEHAFRVLSARARAAAVSG